MTQKQFDYIYNLVRNDTANAIDNQKRAEFQRERMPYTADEKYGYSNKTLNEIINEYREWRAESEECLAALTKLHEDSKKPAVRIESNSATTVKVIGNNNVTIL